MICIWYTIYRKHSKTLPASLQAPCRTSADISKATAGPGYPGASRWEWVCNLPAGEARDPGFKRHWMGGQAPYSDRRPDLVVSTWRVPRRMCGKRRSPCSITRRPPRRTPSEFFILRRWGASRCPATP